MAPQVEGPKPRADLLQPTDAEALQLVRKLTDEARFGALAVLEAGTGLPFVSRVAVSTADDGAPLILVSTLSLHTQGLLADQHCSLLLGEPGKGDPLAHPRVTLICEARKIARDSAEHEAALVRHLAHHPKAKLYASFEDFQFFRLEPHRASLVGGFGKAYALTSEQLLTR